MWTHIFTPLGELGSVSHLASSPPPFLGRYVFRYEMGPLLYNSQVSMNLEVWHPHLSLWYNLHHLFLVEMLWGRKWTPPSDWPTSLQLWMDLVLGSMGDPLSPLNRASSPSPLYNFHNLYFSCLFVLFWVLIDWYVFEVWTEPRHQVGPLLFTSQRIWRCWGDHLSPPTRASSPSPLVWFPRPFPFGWGFDW